MISGVLEFPAVRHQVKELPLNLQASVIRQNPKYALSIKPHLSDQSQFGIPLSRILLP